MALLQVLEKIRLNLDHKSHTLHNRCFLKFGNRDIKLQIHISLHGYYLASSVRKGTHSSVNLVHGVKHVCVCMCVFTI